MEETACLPILAIGRSADWDGVWALLGLGLAVRVWPRRSRRLKSGRSGDVAALEALARRLTVSHNLITNHHHTLARSFPPRPLSVSICIRLS